MLIDSQLLDSLVLFAVPTAVYEKAKLSPIQIPFNAIRKNLNKSTGYRFRF
jgi:hypothetical protein